MPRDAAELEVVLDALGVEPARALGQNFLLDRGVADREAALLDVPAGTEVLEIGGGLGQLTRSLLRRGFRVRVVERDRRLAAYLEMNFGPTVRVLVGDARRLDLPDARVCAGNLPFAAAGEILERLVAGGMEHGAFLLQREVAERLTAAPGRRAYGRSTVLFRVDGEFRLALPVPARAFLPAPRVEGALVVWRRDPLDPAPRDRRGLALLLEAAFQHRRKMLGGRLPAAVARLAHAPTTASVAEWFGEAGWPDDWPRRRAEEVAPSAYVALANLLADRTATGGGAGPGPSASQTARSGP